MASGEILMMLSNSRQFQKSGKGLQQISNHIANLLATTDLTLFLNQNFHHKKNFIKYINLLQFANKTGDSLLETFFTVEEIKYFCEKGLETKIEDLSDVTDIELRDLLKQDYLNFKDIEISTIETRAVSFIKPKSKSVPRTESSTNSLNWPIEDEEYWIRSIDLHWPTFPQPNVNDIIYQYEANGHIYCIYGDGVTPWDQSQISCVTDVNKFSDQDILNLFPPIRLYTRSREMYSKYSDYDSIEYDEDLGVIFSIPGYSYDQMKQNIIEYPHFDVPDRWVKIKGREQTIPFWHHIEIDGEMYQTSKVWEELPGTKDLPKTESFMNEYVVRKYILDSTIKGVEFKSNMRGDLSPFITLYNNPDYYQNLGYDPIEIGKKCIIARRSWKRSRNPIIKMMQDAGMSI